MIRFFLTAAVALAMSGVAGAQGKLLASSPAADATIARPTKLTLTFSETILAPMSGAELVMTAMPGMSDHPAMPIRGFRIAVEDKTMTLTFPRALPTGSYDLKWHIVGADEHKMEGGYSFKVK